MVVPCVASSTLNPTSSPSVNMLLTSGWPNSVSLAAYSASRWRRAGFIVIVLKSTLSVSVTVRVSAWRMTSPTSSSSNQRPP